MTKFVFCNDLDAPELAMIMDDKWAVDNSDEIIATPGLHCSTNRSLRSGDFLLIPDEEDRLMFILKWGA